MKYKLIGIGSFVLLTVIAFALSFAVAEEGKVKRVHQHITDEPKEQCVSHIEEDFCTHMPIVKIETGGKVIPGMVTGKKDIFNEDVYTLTEAGENMTEVSISVIDNKGKNNHLEDTPDFVTKTLIRYRGHASRYNEKAPYLLKFIDDEGKDNDIKVMGMDKHNEWILNGPYLDKSLVRNYMFYNIAGEIMEYAPNVLSERILL